MSCFSPWLASDSGGAVRSVACGRCHDCRLEYSRQWAVRCVHEASLWDYNSFVTLTYKDDSQFSLDYSHFQLFMRYLRRTGRKVRFYMCGEYGEIMGRPHYHALLFNCQFPDMKYWRMSDAGFKLYRSAELERLWPHGFSDIGMVTFESAAYCARYVMKKVHGEGADVHYTAVDGDGVVLGQRVREFSRMSLRPGIGSVWFDKFGRSDVVPDGMVVSNGVKVVAPKFYRRRIKARFPFEYRRLQWAMEQKMVVDAEDAPKRLEAKAAVSLARGGQLKRSLK